MVRSTDPLERLLPACPAGRHWVPVRTGESEAAVFRRSDNAVYAKCAPRASAQELDGERQRIAWLGSYGIASPTVLDWTQSDSGACLISTAVPGVPAAELTGRNLLDAWPSLARTVRSLHDIPTVACPFERRLTTVLRTAADVVRRNAVNLTFLQPEQRQTPPATLLQRLGQEVPERVRQEAEDLVVCHGDACLPNFVVDPDTMHCTGLIDLGRLGVADRYVDLALLVANSKAEWSTPDESRQAFDTLFNLHGLDTPDHDRLRFYANLDPLTWG